MRTRLSGAKEVADVDVVGRGEHEAQVYLSYSGELDRLQAALAQYSLELTSSEGQYTLQLGAVSATTASFAMTR